MDLDQVDFPTLSLYDRDLALLGLIDKLSQITQLLTDRLETLEAGMSYNDNDSIGGA